MVNGPGHLDLSFPGNNLSLELKSNTCWLGWKSCLSSFLSWYLLTLSLYSFEDSFAINLISSNSNIYNLLFSLDAASSKFKNFKAQYALCSISTSKWQEFPYTIWNGDMPIEVLNAILYAHKASSNLSDQSFLVEATVFSKILFNSLFDTSAWPLVWGW